MYYVPQIELKGSQLYQCPLQSFVSLKKSSIIVHATHIAKIVVDLREGIT